MIRKILCWLGRHKWKWQAFRDDGRCYMYGDCEYCDATTSRVDD